MVSTILVMAICAASNEVADDLKAYNDTMAKVEALGEPKDTEEYQAIQEKAIPIYKGFLGEYGTSLLAEGVRWRLFQAYRSIGRVDEARELINDIESFALDRLLQVALARGWVDDPDGAMRILEWLAKADDPETRIKAARYLKSIGNEERALAILDELVEKGEGPELRARALRAKADLYRIGDREKRAEILQDLVRRFPKTKDARMAKGILQAADLGPGKDPIPFTSTGLNGKEIDLKNYKGKVVLLDFWATWCGPCIHEIPTLKRVHDKYRTKGFEIIGISLDSDIHRAKKFVEEEDIRWPQIADGKGWESELGLLYDVLGIPFTVLIGRDGKVIDLKLRGEELEKAVAKAVGKAG